jgi:hypothetical protein
MGDALCLQPPFSAVLLQWRGSFTGCTAAYVYSMIVQRCQGLSVRTSCADAGWGVTVLQRMLPDRMGVLG